MRNKKMDDLLKQVILEEAEEQGVLWEKETPIEPVPRQSQTRFDASLNSLKPEEQAKPSDSVHVRDARKASRPLPRRLLTFGLAAASCAALVLIVSILLKTGGIRRPTAANDPVSATASATPLPLHTASATPLPLQPTPQPSAANGTDDASAAEATPLPVETTPTPWAGDGHWYTFTVLPSGVVNSANQHYNANYGPYFVMPQNEVAIGRFKGVLEEVRMYTSDPEERIIWSYEKTDVVYGMFIRDDVTLPEPDPEICGYALCVWADFEQILSEDAAAELRVLIEKLEKDGEPIEVSEDMSYAISYVFPDSEIPDLRYMLSMSIIRYNGQAVLLSGVIDAGSNAWKFTMTGIDQDSALYREFCEWEQTLSLETEQTP